MPSASVPSVQSLLILALITLVFASIARVSGAPLAQAEPATRTTTDGVYSEAQAARGQAVFDEKCTDCHTAAMWGTDWNTKSVFDVYDFISQYMPEADPGSLSEQQTRDVVAFILQANKLPAGPADLPEPVVALKQIRLETLAK